MGDFTNIKVVHSDTLYCTIFEEIGDETEVTSWMYIDPCGSVPAMLFNLMLDDQMAFVIAMKNDLEK